MSIEQPILAGIGWSAGAQVLKASIHFVISVVLARLLSPLEFGLLGMITVATSFVLLFAEFGFTAALIHRRELEERHRSSIFWANLAAGLALTGLTWAAAPLLAAFFQEPRLVPLTRLVSVTFLVSSLGVVQMALLNRDLRFRSLGVVDVVATSASGVAAIVLAVVGYGVWSLVWQMVAYVALHVAGLWLASRWRPRRIFELAAVRELLPYSANYVGFTALNYWVRNTDNLLIGRFVGPAGLGVYSRAYSTMLLPITQVAAVLGRVMFPALSRIQEDAPEVKRLYLRSLRAIALVTFPMMLGLLATADGFVLSLFGPQWAEVIPVLRILCLVGLSQSLGTTTGWIYQSQGRTDLMFRWGLASGAVTLAAFAIGIFWGVMGIAIAYALRTFGLTYFNFSIPGRLIGLRFGEVVRAVRGVFLCAAAMATLVAGAGLLTPVSLPREIQFVGEIVLGVLAYGALIHLSKLDSYGEIRASLATAWRHRREQHRGHRPDAVESGGP